MGNLILNIILSTNMETHIFVRNVNLTLHQNGFVSAPWYLVNYSHEYAQWSPKSCD